MSKRVHILGICGTFMGGVALLARELGYEVTGSDVNVYPPMGGYTLTSDPVTSYPSSRASSATPPIKVPQIPSMCTRLDIKRSKMQR